MNSRFEFGFNFDSTFFEYINIDRKPCMAFDILTHTKSLINYDRKPRMAFDILTHKTNQTEKITHFKIQSIYYFLSQSIY